MGVVHVNCEATLPSSVCEKQKGMTLLSILIQNYWCGDSGTGGEVQASILPTPLEISGPVITLLMTARCLASLMNIVQAWHKPCCWCFDPPGNDSLCEAVPDHAGFNHGYIFELVREWKMMKVVFFVVNASLLCICYSWVWKFSSTRQHQFPLAWLAA